MSVARNECSSTENISIAGYCAVKYCEEWWHALIFENLRVSKEVKVSFLHPKGPSSTYFFPEFEDSCWLDAADVIMKVEPTTATGRTCTLSKSEKTMVFDAWSSKKVMINKSYRTYFLKFNLSGISMEQMGFCSGYVRTAHVHIFYSKNMSSS